MVIADRDQAGLIERIQKARRELLDLSARNRLISTPRGASQGRRIEVVDERSEEVFRLLVRERKSMSFLPGADAPDEGTTGDPDSPRLAQPDEDSAGGGTVDPRHVDLRLQTRLTSERLQARLLSVFYDAQTFEQEQGVSILYLAMGFLKWFESPASDNPRFAPLLLIPVDLERPTAASRFHLKHREEEIATNLSLREKLRGGFAIDLPEVPESEDLSPSAYFDAVALAAADQPRWEVLRDDMVIWFFSFAKYLMYRDLDPASWPGHAPLGGNPTLANLLGDGFSSEPPICGEDEKIDPLIPTSTMVHVADADSSQAVAIEEVRRGRHLVIQGPPGTGKSQTITNLIATAVKSGKKVLFVAEKMAALEVVHGRLARLGLGPICLELHSNKANKKGVLGEIERTLALGRPKMHASEESLERLEAAIDRLNRHADVMNAVEEPSGLSPFQVIGRLSALYGRGAKPSSLGLAGLESWTAGEYLNRCHDLADLQAHLNEIGDPRVHLWRGVGRVEPMLHEESRRFFDEIGEAADSLDFAIKAGAELSSILGLADREEASIRDVRRLARFASFLGKAPPMDRLRIDGPAWAGRAEEIAGIVDRGRALADSRYREQRLRLEDLSGRLDRIGRPEEHPFRGVRRGEPFSGDELGRVSGLVGDLAETLRALRDHSRDLGRPLGIEPSDDGGFQQVQQLAQLAIRISRAPRLDRRAIRDAVWDSARERIAELVERGQALAAARADLADRVSEIAWRAELSATRRHLAGHGRSLFRWFYRDYRGAVASLAGILKGEPPEDLDGRLAILDAVISAQANARVIEDDPTSEAIGREAFGSEWKGMRSDWSSLAAIVAWDEDCRACRLPYEHRGILAGLDEPSACLGPLNALSARLRPGFDRLMALIGTLDLHVGEAFGVGSIQAVPIRLLIDRLGAWREQPEALGDWIEYRGSLLRLEAAGLGEKASAIREGRLSTGVALDEIEAAFEVELGGGLGPEAFGSPWKGILSDWDALAAIAAWDRECRGANLAWDHRLHLARLDAPESIRTPLGTLVKSLDRLTERLPTILQAVAFNFVEGFGCDSEAQVAARELRSRLQGWRDKTEGISKWIGYQRRRSRLKAAGLSPIVDGLHDGTIAAEEAVDQLQVAYHQALIREIYLRHPDLAEFEGLTHDRWVAEFRSLDASRIESARAEVAVAHYDAIPRHASGGEMAVLLREFEKKRKHKPIRRLIKEAGTAIQAIKPVFLMSPVSVAQFLEPGSVAFDLLLIDEASQVRPVDALGAMARCAQVVVVGDDRQLPPTRFFSKMLGDDEAPGDDDFDAGDLESILGLCVAQGMSQRMLRWHYRSRHHSLIAVSNREFYDGRLFVVPSPEAVSPERGLHFRAVEGGVFDRGNSATNRIEARAVALAAIEHAGQNPSQTLGIGAFSVAQRDAIRDELEVLQREHPELSAFFSPGRPEPFFVKNLENIQGDERDVVFISVGYARDPSGYMAMSFGPLSTEGGERRLNVLISRARERCEVFSSITADDIDLQRAKSRGAAAFKTFLRYAATGTLDSPRPTGGDFDSDFEAQVSRALEGRGFEVHRQVGTAGFVIDLAIVDPERPGRYLLGIECDGATYHASRSARDRDRLRQAVLEDRGWTIHRVWSTDWFHRPGEQLLKLLGAIEKARIGPGLDERPAVGPAAEFAQPAPAGRDIERTPEPGLPNGEPSFPWATRYVEASPVVPNSTPIPETSLEVLEGLVTEVVLVEGPIHKEEVARRLTSLWGQQRTGARISGAVSRAIEAGVRSGNLSLEADFIVHQGQSTVPVRNRSEVVAPNLKKPEMIPPSELRRAIRCLVAEQVGLRRDELPPLVGKVIGFKATSMKFRDIVEEVLASMVAEDEVDLRGEKLLLREHSRPDPP